MDLNEINSYISIINKSKNMRKLNLSDIYDDSLSSVTYDSHSKKEPKLKKFRQQQEFGEKKRIKP